MPPPPPPRGLRALAEGGLTPRALLAGLLIGVLQCFSNTYFGLQTGFVSMGSLQSTLLGFGLMRGLAAVGGPGGGFSAHENVVLQTTAVAAATMPLAGGFVGILPALQCLPPSEALTLTGGQQLLWGFALAFFGVFFAVPLRRQTILREKLRFPSGTATAKMVSVLHRLPDSALDPELHRPGTAAAVAGGNSGGLRRRLKRREADDEAGLIGGAGAPVDSADGADGDEEEDDDDGDVVVAARRGGNTIAVRTGGVLHPVVSLEEDDGDDDDVVAAAGDGVVPADADFDGALDDAAMDEEDEDGMSNVALWRRKWLLLFISFGVSALLALVAYFIPILMALPVFTWVGLPAATAFGWTLTPSLSYVGQGMIMGHKTGWSMLLGIIVGWAILAPTAAGNGWAPEETDPGAKRWLLWVSLSIMLAESLASLGVIIVQMGVHYLGRGARRRRRALAAAASSSSSSSSSSGAGAGATAGGEMMTSTLTHEHHHDPAPPHEQVPAWWWMAGLGVSSVFSCVVLSLIFSMPWYEPVIAVAASLLVSVLAVRALGETDLNPVSGVGKVSQLIFAGVAPGAVVSNIVAGAVAEAGAQQAGDLMQDLKCGHLVRASPRAQFVAQLVGSSLSVVFSVIAYALYTGAYPIGGSMFPVPTAQVWVDMAQLLSTQGKSLGDNVLPFCLVGGGLAAVIPVLQAVLDPKRHRWVTYLPSGVSFAIAMYISPNWTIPRVVGATLQFYWARRYPRNYARYMIIVASGLVLGEGIMSIVTAIFATVGVPRLEIEGAAPSNATWCGAP